MLEPGTLIGKYVVRRKIAEGGMAEIYLCSFHGPEGFEKDVVIKRIRPMFAADESFVQMFINEAKVASRLNHANLVQILDFDKHEDTYYLAMEYVRGRSLWELRKRSKELMQSLPPTLAAHIGAQVARGLGHAHALQDKGKPVNLVHRDVTPHNVLLSYDGAVKLTDFGVAKSSASATSAGVLKGKYAYMSPEQSRGDPVDLRTDLFALGIVLWEMLTGGRLFDGDSDVAVLRAVQTSIIAPPSRLNPSVPAALNDVVMTALQRAPEERFQSGAQMERALQQFVLAHAKSLEDTDLPAHLRRLFPEDEGTRIATSPGAPSLAPTAHERSPAPSAGSGAVLPDEDMHAPTYAVAAAATVSGRSLPAEPSAAPDTRPLSALAWLPTVGMRRAIWVGLGMGALISVAGGVILVQNQASPIEPQAVAPAVARPIEAAAEPPPAPAMATPQAAPVEASAPAEPAVPGTLQLKVRPYAQVFIDGKYLREVEGRSMVSLAAGEHTVKLRHPRGDREFHVVISPGKPTRLEQSFITP